MKFNLTEKIQNDKISKILLDIVQENSELYIVGGYLRDLFLDKYSFDRDYVIIGESAAELAKKFAEKVDGYFVHLDDTYDIARVVMPDKKHYVDIAKCDGDSIEADLPRRDFTINALSCQISDDKVQLIDLFKGVEDLKNGIIRTPKEENIVEDPLRIVRAYRFSSQLSVNNLPFKIEKNTSDYLLKHIDLLQDVSIERVNTELIKLFEGDNTAYNLNELKNNKILYNILPEMQAQVEIPPNPHHHLCLIDHSIESVRQVEMKIAQLPKWLHDHLESEFIPGVKTIAFLKLATFLHDLGKPQTWKIDDDGRHRFIKHDEVGGELSVELLKRLKFSKKASKYVSKLVKNHIYPSQLLRSDEPTSEKAILKMFRKLDAETPDVIVLAMGDRLSARGPKITDDIVEANINGLFWLLDKYKSSQEQLKPLPKLISGEELMQLLNIKQGPQVGKILTEIREAQISSEISTKEEAINLAKGIKL